MGNWKKAGAGALALVFVYSGALGLSKYVGCTICVDVLTAGQSYVPHDEPAAPTAPVQPAQQ